MSGTGVYTLGVEGERFALQWRATPLDELKIPAPFFAHVVILTIDFLYAATMTHEQESFLQRLIECPGPSNYEEQVQSIWREEVRSHVDELRIDPHGNHIATLKGTQNISILIVGHADEIGLIVKYISDTGFIYVAPVGGVEAAILPSHHVRILSSVTGEIVHGVVGRTSVHLKDKTDDGKMRFTDVYIDIGAPNKEAVEKLIAIGDVVIYGQDYTRLHGTRATARCFDNRIGIYVVAEVLKKLAARRTELRATVYGVSSIQEETGLWGAPHSAYLTDPTMAIAIDVMPCTDSPGISKELHGDTRISAGAVLDRGIRSNKKMSRRLIELAAERKIPFQINVENGHTHTDADPISSVKAGIPVCVVSAPTRYLHSAIEVLDLEDLDHCVNLVSEFILSLEEGWDLRPGM